MRYWLICSATTREQIRLVFGRADENEAVIRLTVDAILLDILSSIKMELEQYEGGKGKRKRTSTEAPLGHKNLRMALETHIFYIFPTHGEKGVVDRLISGRMDYNLWYGNPREAETNLLVVEAKSRSAHAAGRYQAISYTGKQLTESASILNANQLIPALIQHARHKAGRAKTPIYGVATDSHNWDFIRMDASGSVRGYLIDNMANSGTD